MQIPKNQHKGVNKPVNAITVALCTTILMIHAVKERWVLCKYPDSFNRNNLREFYRHYSFIWSLFRKLPRTHFFCRKKTMKLKLDIKNFLRLHEQKTRQRKLPISSQMENIARQFFTRHKNTIPSRISIWQMRRKACIISCKKKYVTICCPWFS